MAKLERLTLSRAELEKGELPRTCLLTGATTGVELLEVALPVRPVRLAALQAAGLLLALLAGWLLGGALGLPAQQRSSPAWVLAGVLVAGDRLLLDGRWPPPLRLRLPVVPGALALWQARQRQARVGQALSVLGCGLGLGLGPFLVRDPAALGLLGGLVPAATMGAAAWLQLRANSPRLALAELTPESVVLLHRAPAT